MSPTVTRNRLRLEDFPDSVYARELRRGSVALRFAEPLEAQYATAHLERVRLRVRIWNSISALIALIVSVPNIWHYGIANGVSLLRLTVFIPSGALLAALVWSRYYERLYFRVAGVLVPVFYGTVAAFIGVDFPRGGYLVGEPILAILATHLMAVFFFAGLKYRQALGAAAVMLLAFTLAALLAGSAPLLLFKALVVLLLTAGIAAIVYRDVEQSYRMNFLELSMIAELVARDALTGLMNRRCFDEHMRMVWKQAQRSRHAIAILMIDIDRFKALNDTHGHQAGDAIIARVASCMKDIARRPLDLAARYGGDEFAVILYDLPPTHAFDIAERLRASVQKLSISISDLGVAQPLQVTASVGLGFVVPSAGRSPEGALQLADEGLYEAKAGGRNRVVVKAAEDYARLKTGMFKAIQGGHRLR